MYGVFYKDGHKASLADNAIADNIIAQVDREENQHVIFQDIFYHRYDSTEVKEQDMFITTLTGTKCCRDMMKGVEFLVQ